MSAGKSRSLEYHASQGTSVALLSRHTDAAVNDAVELVNSSIYLISIVSLTHTQ